jgi:anthranilate phosphoribosyltransferase
LDAVGEGALEPGGSLKECGEIFVEAVTDAGSDRARAVYPSAAAAIFLSGLARDLVEAARMARESVSSGAAREKLDLLTEMGTEG